MKSDKHYKMPEFMQVSRGNVIGLMTNKYPSPEPGTHTYLHCEPRAMPGPSCELESHAIQTITPSDS